LLVYGDHQPFSFTGTHMVRYDFGPFRTPVPKTVTFFHIRASENSRLRCCLQDVPATLLPTLVSAFAAAGPRDVYVGANLWLYERCGHDAVGSQPLFEITRQAASESDVAGTGAVRTASCADAYDRALVAYRRANLMNLERQR
jgi:hypothetical protein